MPFLLGLAMQPATAQTPAPPTILVILGDDIGY